MNIKTDIIERVAELGLKMRLFKARHTGNNLSELKDRDVLILELLGQQSGMNGVELGSHFKGLSLSSISVDLKKLRNLKLVNREIDKKDERKYKFGLTKKGTARLLEIRELRKSMFEPLANALGEDINELKIISKFIQKAIDGLDKL